MKSIAMLVFLAATSATAMAGNLESAGCALAGAVVRGDVDARQAARDVYQGSQYDSGGGNCYSSEVAPYAIQNGVQMLTGESGGYNTGSMLIQQAASSAYYGDRDGAKASMQQAGVEMLLNAVFGR